MRRTAALVCFFLSGCAGLIYEVCWIRRASLVFGSTTLALSSVLAVFFAGLAAGSELFGRAARRTTRPLRLYAALELGLAAFALLSPLAFDAADAAYGPVYRALAGHAVALFVPRLLLVAIVLIVPTVLMGGTLPLFCGQFVVRESRIAGTIGFLYGLNTRGAVAGCAATGFLLLPRLGAHDSILLAAALNAAAGLTMLVLAPSGPAHGSADAAPAPPAPETAGATAPRPEAAGRQAALVGARCFVTGLVALGAEVAWTRFLGLVVRNTVTTYTITLTVVLAGIVLGSLIAARLGDRVGARAVWFGAFQVAAALVTLALMSLPPAFWRGLGRGPGPFLVLMLAPAALSGASFPLAIRMVLHDPALSAARVGRLTALNTLGGIVGSLLIGFAVLPLLGLAPAVRVVTGFGLASGIAAWLLLDRGAARARRAALAGAAVLAAAAWLVVPLASRTRLPADFLGARGELVDYREGLGSNLAVLLKHGVRQLMIDRWWQGEDRKGHQIMAAHVPMLLHPDPRDVLVVGVGTGQTASRFLLYPIAHLDAVDIEPAIFPFVARNYDAAWMRDPRVALVPDDGRTFVAHGSRRYDLISIEVGQVFRPGVESFYTREFYRRAAARLKPGGLLAQFVPLGFLTTDEFRGVLRTFLEEFPQSVLWYNTGEMLLIGAKGPRIGIDPSRLALVERPGPIHEDLRWAYWGGDSRALYRPEMLLGGFVAGPDALARIASGAPVYRDDRPVLAYAAAKLVAGQGTELPTVDLLTRNVEPVAELFAGGLPDSVATVAAVVRDQYLRDIAAEAYVGIVETGQSRLSPQQMQQYLEEALRLNPDKSSANRLMGDALVLGGAYAAAGSYFEAAVRADPDDTAAKRGLALVCLNTQRPRDALTLLQDVLSHDPGDALAHNYLGALLTNSGRFTEAIYHFQEALRLMPGYANAAENLAKARAAQAAQGVR